MTSISSAGAGHRYRPPRPLGGRQRLRSSSTGSRRQAVMAATFLLPALVVLGAFVFWPMISALRLSFMRSSGFGPSEWVGFDNYVEIFQDDKILNTLGVTGLYTVMFVPAALLLALGLAILLTQKSLWGTGAFRTALFVPFIVSMAVAGFAWSYLLDPQLGLLNYWLGRVGIHLGNVLQDPQLALPTVVLVAVWKNFGFYMVVFIAGLQQVPAELHDAARIDGASTWQRFRHVTVPQLSTTFAFVVVFASIAALQAFDQIYVMTGGGPYRHTETVVAEIYSQGFKKLDLGLASALSYVLLVITLALGLVQLRFFGRKEKDVIG